MGDLGPDNETANEILRSADKGTTAKERGYSHGELPGPGRGVSVLHLTQAHWQNVGGGFANELSASEADEERRGAGALADERYQGDEAWPGFVPKAAPERDYETENMRRRARRRAATPEVRWSDYPCQNPECGLHYKTERPGVRGYCDDACKRRAKYLRKRPDAKARPREF